MTAIQAYTLSAHIARVQRIIKSAGEIASDRFCERIDRIFSERNVVIFLLLAALYFGVVMIGMVGRG